MADPFTGGMAAVGLVTSLIGGGMTAYGQQQAGASNSAMYKYRAGVAQMNAKIAGQNADYALMVGETQAQRSGLTTGLTIAKQKVAQSANGIDVNSGSNEAVRDSTRDIGIIDQTTIRANAGRRAQSFRNQAMGLEAEGTGDIMAADNAKRSGDIGGLGTLIGTAGSVASKWGQASQTWSGGGSGITTYDSNMQVSGYYR